MKNINEKYQRLGTDFVTSIDQVNTGRSYAIQTFRWVNWKENLIYIGSHSGIHIFLDVKRRKTFTYTTAFLEDLIMSDRVAFTAPNEVKNGPLE